VAADEPAVTVEATAVTPAPGPAPIARRVTGDQVNLREGPDADTPSLGLLSLDDMVEVLDENGGWMRVRTEEGEEGWVAARFLAAVPD
jgi:SH3-like domain-containing protein